MKLLKESGLAINNGRDQLKTQALNFPVEILFLRDDDIPQYIEDKVADVGIVGENIYVEKNKKTTLVKRLDFAKCTAEIAKTPYPVWNSMMRLRDDRAYIK